MKRISTDVLKLPRFGAELRSIDRTFKFGRLLRALSAAMAALIGLAVLVGFALRYEPAWRLGEHLPAVHPYTAICITLLALGLFPGSRRSSAVWRHAARAAVVAALFLLLVRVAVPLFGDRMFQALTPFSDTAAAQRALGKPLSMGLVVAWTLLLIALGEALRWTRRPVLSQIFAACALSLLFMAATGYLAELRPFFGTMAPATLLGSALLAFSLLFATSRRGFMRGLTANSAPGRMARTLLASSTAFLLLMGWVVTHRIDAPGIPLPADGELLVYQTALVLAWTWAIVTVITVRADQLDRYRGLSERLFERTATRDALTGLFTRNHLMRLTRKSVFGQAQPSAYLLVDLDRFRTVNEAFGPEEGDRLLVEVAERLRGAAAGSFVGRLGGDEFAVLCARMSDSEAEELGAELVRTMAKPFAIRGRDFRLSASVGIAQRSCAAGTKLEQAADDAMHVAKTMGGNRSVVFAPHMHEMRMQHVELEQDLHEALRDGGQLGLHYQPVVHVEDRRVLAIEALARWEHPRLGPIPPDRFIAIAETTGLMVALGKKLMQIAVEQAVAWEAERPGSCPLLNINVSPVQFFGSDVVGDLSELVRRHGLQPHQFCLEITESVFAAAPAVQALERARALGFRVAMDDFGIGYSTLSQLPRLPLTSLKLDRSFIVNATESAGDAAILLAIVQLAHALNLVVVAEGVETRAQFDLVATVGCDAVQGYLVARPMRPDALQAWLSDLPEERSHP